MEADFYCYQHVRVLLPTPALVLCKVIQIYTSQPGDGGVGFRVLCKVTHIYSCGSGVDLSDSAQHPESKRGNSPTRKRFLLGPYTVAMPRALWWP